MLTDHSEQTLILTHQSEQTLILTDQSEQTLILTHQSEQTLILTDQSAKKYDPYSPITANSDSKWPITADSDSKWPIRADSVTVIYDVGNQKRRRVGISIKWYIYFNQWQKGDGRYLPPPPPWLTENVNAFLSGLWIRHWRFQPSPPETPIVEFVGAFFRIFSLHINNNWTVREKKKNKIKPIFYCGESNKI